MSSRGAASGDWVGRARVGLMSEATFPLLPRRRITGLAFGTLQSAKRGTGSDVAGTRPYVPGDDVDSIHWSASARLSSAHDRDEFIVRMRYSDEAPRVVLAVDRRPEMALAPPGLPWLRKPDAIARTIELVEASAREARGFVGLLEQRAHGETVWRAPERGAELTPLENFDAPPDTVARALDFLSLHRASAPPGTFVFLVSDFLAPPPTDALARALEQRWDVIPVVIQDPVWEQSFPDVGGLVLRVAGADGRVRALRLSRRETDARRAGNEARLRDLLDRFRRLAIEPVLVSSADPRAVLGSFLEWAARRRRLRGRSR